ncbi:hypothetical protein NKR23_g5830 [Pleurostoma richardsiae]|uniref:DUF6594 domain-containing protein n=1 Tax=Pleurostoma richardsiae TaxID=41990 RepID=A0AA38RFU6_9PEZI|nr:hypothetical protein NKR23_g5830 [Pleurostoma richardsiae]
MAVAANIELIDLEAQTAEITQDDLDLRPWKYIGYKGFSKFAAADDDHFALRRFDRLHTRTLLRHQAKLSSLEAELDMIDDRLSSKDAPDIDNGYVIGDPDGGRVALQEMINEALQKYDSLLYHYMQLKNRPKTTPTVTRNIGLWFNNRNNPIHADEAGFLSQQDLISVARFEKPPLRTIFEQRVLLPLAKRWNRHYPRDETLLSENTTAIVAPEPIDTFLTFFIFLVATAMLVVPLWALAIVTGMFRKLGIITICLFLFLGVLNWGTLSRPFEILAATAGYSAVLVVFLQLGQSAADS